MANPLAGIMGGNASTAVAQSAPVNAPLSNMGAIRQVAQQAKKLMGMLQAVRNPQQAFMMAAQQDPQLNATLQMLGGRNPVDVLREECQKRGMNFNEVMSALNQ